MTDQPLTFSRDDTLAEQERAIIRTLYADKTANLMVADPHHATAQRAVLDLYRQLRVPFDGEIQLVSGDGRTFAYACAVGRDGTGEVAVTAA